MFSAHDALYTLLLFLVAILVSLIKRSLLVGFVILSFSFLFAINSPPEIIGISCSLGLLLAFGYSSLRHPLNRSLLLVLSTLLASALVWGKSYEATFGGIDEEAVEAIFQTDPTEAVLFLRFSGIPLQEGILLLCFFVCQVVLWPNPTALRRTPSALVAFLIILSIAGACDSWPQIHSRVVLISKSIERYRKHRSSYLYFRARFKQSVPSLPISVDKTISVVLVMGESLSRHHMSLYNYYRRTTPKIDLIRERQNDRFLVFNDVVSPHSHTAPSITQMLSAADSANGLPWQRTGHINIFTALQAAGVPSVWISNQNRYGFYENPVMLLAEDAAEKQFIRSLVGWHPLKKMYDDQVVTRFIDSFQARTNPAFWFLHFYAAHLPYCTTYPQSYSGGVSEVLDLPVFGPAKNHSKDVDCYDKAVSFVDENVFRILEEVDKSRHPVITIFTSDHGEAPMLGTQHSSSRHSAYHIEVPFVVHFNPLARTRMSEVYKALANRVDTPYITTDLYHLLSDLFKLDKNLYVTERSLLSYQPRKRRLFGLDAKFPDIDDRSRHAPLLEYDTLTGDKKDYLERTRINMGNLRGSNPALGNKIWAHRINSIGALFEAARYFHGVELDLVFDGKEFKVYHPPAKDIGLSLTQYLASAQRLNPNLSFWFDWKNASKDNIAPALLKLRELDRHFKLRDRIIIETGPLAIFSSLKAISMAGFKHSYYLSFGRLAECKSRICRHGIRNFARAARLIGAVGISYSFSEQRVVARYRQLFKRYRKFTWAVPVNTNNDDFQDRVKSLERFDVGLVTFPSIFRP
jgi:glucan phosphoethanolaminetransferase (alkaline phosphatase superfamily)